MQSMGGNRILLLFHIENCLNLMSTSSMRSMSNRVWIINSIEVMPFFHIKCIDRWERRLVHVILLNMAKIT